MKIKIVHENTYSYNSPVFLEPHIIKLYPRSNPNLLIKKGEIKILPKPSCITNFIDEEGNSTTQAWFKKPTTVLNINSSFQVETFCLNPFDFCTHPLDLTFPFEYEAHFKKTIGHYLEKIEITDQSLFKFIDLIEKDSNKNVINFFMNLTKSLKENLTYRVREE